jgi:hypothetical protein
MMTHLSEEREDVFLQVTKDRGGAEGHVPLEKRGKSQFFKCL